MSQHPGPVRPGRAAGPVDHGSARPGCGVPQRAGVARPARPGAPRASADPGWKRRRPGSGGPVRGVLRAQADVGQHVQDPSEGAGCDPRAWCNGAGPRPTPPAGRTAGRWGGTAHGLPGAPRAAACPGAVAPLTGKAGQQRPARRSPSRSGCTGNGGRRRRQPWAGGGAPSASAPARCGRPDLERRPRPRRLAGPTEGPASTTPPRPARTASPAATTTTSHLGLLKPLTIASGDAFGQLVKSPLSP